MGTKREPYESLDDYAVRLYTHREEYGINCDTIAVLLNNETGTNKDESAWRKYYRGFMDGIAYEKAKGDKGVVTRILSISDLHYPFAVPVETFAEYIDKTDILVLNGDLIDHQSISKFQKRYRISPMDELIGLRRYLINLIGALKPKEVYVTYGNHEIRMGDYLAKQLDNELQELMPETVIDYLLTDGFTHYDRKWGTKVKYNPLCEVFNNVKFNYNGSWWCQIGDTIFCHPKAYNSSPMKTAEKATIWFRNNGNNFNALVMAHTHRIGSYKIGNTLIYEQGACCDVDKLSYNNGMLINSQKKGFIYLCLDKDNKNMEDKTKIVFLN